jgi:hypothetical protein
LSTPPQHGDNIAAALQLGLQTHPAQQREKQHKQQHRHNLVSLLLWVWMISSPAAISHLSSAAIAAAASTLQGEFVDKLAELIIKTYGSSNKIGKADVFFIQDKRKVPFYDEESGEDE